MHFSTLVELMYRAKKYTKSDESLIMSHFAKETWERDKPRGRSDDRKREYPDIRSDKGPRALNK